jgi:hypothetical protein
MKKLIAKTALLLLMPAWIWAQNPEPRYAGQGYFVVGFGTFEGYSSPPYRPFMWQVGGGGERFLYEGVGVGAEAGIVTWAGSPWPHSAVTASGDSSYHFGRHARPGKLDPFVLGGVSFVGPTQKQGGRGSSAVSFGGGANLWVANHVGWRFEFRDIAGATQFWSYEHYLSWRVALTFR